MNDEYSDIIRQQPLAARAKAVATIDDNPDHAMRALELSEATGVAAPVINGDLENFEREHKQNLAGSIVAENHHIQAYIARNPMAAQLSNDDWGNLDELSRSVKSFGEQSVFGAAVEGFKAGYNSEGQQQEWDKAMSHPVMGPLMRHPVWGGAIATIDSSFRAITGAVFAAAAVAGKATPGNEAEKLRAVRDYRGILEMAMSGQGLNKPTGKATDPYGKALMQEASRLRDVARPYLEAGKEPPVGLEKAFDDIKIEENKLDLKALDAALKKAQDSNTKARRPEIVADFLREDVGVKVDIGISGKKIEELYGTKEPLPDDNLLGWVPRLKEQMAEALATGGDVQVPLADWLARVDPKLAKELRDDIRVRPEGVTANEAKLLKEQEQVARAQEPKDNVVDHPDRFRQVPWGEKVGEEPVGPSVKGEPIKWEVREEDGWHNVYANGALDNQFGAAVDAKRYVDLQTNKPDTIKSAANDPGQAAIDTVRMAAGLDLIQQRNVTKLKLEQRSTSKYPSGENAHSFAFLDEQGKEVGHLNVATLDGGKTLYIEDVASQGYNPMAFGPALMRDILRQLKEAFPEADKLTGHRVSGARDRAGTIGPVKIALAPEFQDLKSLKDMEGLLAGLRGEAPPARKMMLPKGFTEGGPKITTNNVTVQPQYSFSTKQLLDSMNVETARTKYGGGIPKAMYTLLRERLGAAIGDTPVHVVSHAEVQRMLKMEAQVKATGSQGVPAFYNPARGFIVVSDRLMRDTYGEAFTTQVSLHEAVHVFAIDAFAKNPELARLANDLMKETKAAFKELDPEGLKEHSYAWTNLDEFIAEANSNPKMIEDMSVIPISKELAARLGLGEGKHTVWDAFRSLISRALEKLLGVKISDTALDGILQINKLIEEFKGIEGEVARRDEGLRRAPEPKPLDEREAFAKANAIGMTVEQYTRWQKKFDERMKEDLESITADALKDAKKRESKEWKENERIEREEAAKDVAARPDVGADTFLRDGTYNGNKLESRPKLDPDFLTEEQRGKLPEAYFGSKGVNPDDIAGLFGYRSGADLVEHLVAYNEQVKASGMQPAAYRRRLVNAEAERRMLARFGKLEDSILEAAKDRVLSETQIDMLHEETMAAATKAGLEYSITKEQLKEAIRGQFNETLVRQIKSDKYLADAGRAGRTAETHLLKDEFLDYFKTKQQQYIAIVMAAEAKALEKLQKQFDRTAKRFVKREVRGIDQEYTNQIHQLFAETGQKVNRSIQDIQYELGQGEYATLPEFIGAKARDGWELDLPDWLAAGERKSIPEMTAKEFREFKEVIDSLAYVGREVNLIEVAGEKIEFAYFKKQVMENLRELKIRPPEGQGKKLFALDASLTRMEEIVKDLDLRKALGPLFNAMIRPMMESKHKEYQLQERLNKELEGIKGFDAKWRKSLNDAIPNDWFIDPYHPGGNVPFDLTRSNMINIMLNFGNRSNIDKFTKGYGGKEHAKLEARLWDMFDKHATAEDWKFVQKIWDIFGEWRKETDVLYRNLSGIAPKWLDIKPFQTRHGEMAGGYFPIIYDPLRSNITVIKEKKDTDSLFGNNYFRATTSNRYTKDRTGYVDRVDFQGSAEQIASRMYQQIHDIAYRASVMQVSKVIYDRGIRDGIQKYYGKEYADQLTPWLKDIANHYNMNEQATSFWNDLMRRARMNLVGHALGFNLKVIGSPDIGKFNPKAVGSVLSDMDGATKFAWEHSKEIPHSFRNMDRDFRETLEHTIAKRGWEGIKSDAVKFSFLPLVKVSQGFRIVTFVDEMRKAEARGMTQADAAAYADSMVRERHGSTGLPDLPAVMRGSEGMKLATVFYGFFNTMYNWQRQMPGQIRAGEFSKAMGTFYGSVLISAAFGALLFNNTKKDDSWFKIIGKALVLAPLQTVPFVRDAASLALEGFPSRTPFASIISAGWTAANDVSKIIQKKKVEKPIQHAANAIGLSTGLPLGQIGRTSQFLYDTATGKQKPKNILEYVRGIIHGEAKQK